MLAPLKGLNEVPDKLRLDWYETSEPAVRQVRSPEERLANPEKEIDLGLPAEAALEETARCFSCGQCFGCENCWMYCQNNCFKKVEDNSPGHYYTIDISVCDGCKKCADECPCGYIDLV